MTSPKSTSKTQPQASRILSVFFCGSAEGIMKEVLENIYRLHGQTNPFPKGIPDIKSFQSAESHWFANGEVKVQVVTKISEISEKGLFSSSGSQGMSDLYIVQLLDDPLTRPAYGKSPGPVRTINDNLMEVLLAADAAHRAGVGRITLVLPHYPYARQERNAEGECISARVIANFIESVQVDRVLTIDVHSEAIGGFFNKTRFENIQSTAAWAEYLKTTDLEPACNSEDYVVVAPDIGATKKARALASKLSSTSDKISYAHALLDKVRAQISITHDMPEIKEVEIHGDHSGEIKTIHDMIGIQHLVGDVKGKHVILIDDMIATGGTLIAACKALKTQGAENIYILCTFPFFNGDAISKLQEAHAAGTFTRVIGTNMVLHSQAFKDSNPWYRECSLAPLLADHIYRLHTHQSIF